MSLPNWNGAAKVYERCEKINRVLCNAAYEAFKLRTNSRKSDKYTIPEDVEFCIAAMNRGDEETLKAYTLRHINKW